MSTHDSSLDRVFDDPALERKRRACHCALLLANAHRWDTSIIDEKIVEMYLSQMRRRQAEWGLAWEEITACCEARHVVWMVARRLQA